MAKEFFSHKSDEFDTCLAQGSCFDVVCRSLRLDIKHLSVSKRDRMAWQTLGLSLVSGGSMTGTAPDGHLVQAVWTVLMTDRT